MQESHIYSEFKKVKNQMHFRYLYWNCIHRNHFHFLFMDSFIKVTYSVLNYSLMLCVFYDFDKSLRFTQTFYYLQILMRSTSTRCNAPRPPRNTFWTGSPSTGTTSPCPPGTTLKTTASSSIFAVKSEVNNECKTETFKRWKQINCFYNQYLWRGLWIKY